MNALVAAAARIGMPHQRRQHRHLDDAAADAEQRRDVAGDERRHERHRQPFHPIAHLEAALVDEAAAEAADVAVAVGPRLLLLRAAEAPRSRRRARARRKAVCSVDALSICAVTPPSSPPAAVATSSTMPRRKLIRCRPVDDAAAETDVDVAITAIRLTAAAALNGTPATSTRNGTRKTPPPMPSMAPMQAGDHADAKRHRGERRGYEHAGSVIKIGNRE